MIKRLFSWKVLLGLGLVLLSGILYYLHFVIFKDAHHIFIYLLGDIAFVPIEVLMVTLIIHQVLVSREKKVLFRKLNMLIGAFFSNVGTQLLDIFSKMDPDIGNLTEDLRVDNKWTAENFMKVNALLRSHTYNIDLRR